MLPHRLKEILDAVRTQEDLKPVEGKTFCNIALDRVLGLCGIPRLVNRLNGLPLMANDMIDAMRNSPTRWEEVTGEVAVARALKGVLVVAAQQKERHGHVAPVYPLPPSFSPSWGKDAPILSNVGVRNEVMRASMCFRTEPLYFSSKIYGTAET